MITQCSACGTLFRVVPDQLKLAEGWVRCGECGEVFDAAAQLQDDAELAAGSAAAASRESAAPAAAPVPPAPVPPAPAGAGEPLAPGPATDRQAGAPPTGPEPAVQGPVAPRPAPEPQVPDRSDLAPQADQAQASQAQQDGTAPPEYPTDPFDAGAVPPPSRGVDVLLEDLGGAPPAEDVRVQPRAPRPPAAPASSGGEPAWYAEFRQSLGGETSAEPEPAEADPFAGPALDDMSFVREARSRAFWQKTWVRVLLGLAALVLLLLLAAQVALQQRDRLAASYPPLRPMLESLCRPFGCVVQAPRQIEAIVIDSSSFNRLGPQSYRLALTLRNQADIGVAMPSLELTLTDANEQPVFRRVLAPSELGPDTPGVLAPAAEWSTVLDLNVAADPAGARIAGYRLLAFYP